METKFNFNSAICTSIEQSRRLLKLGLKKETADCYWYNYNPSDFISENWINCIGTDYGSKDIPAWSLHRLIEMMPKQITYKGLHYVSVINIGDPLVGYYQCNLAKAPLEYFYGNDTIYDDCICCIEWLIKKGYFPKEYLV